jgi:hypothetical protein
LLDFLRQRSGSPSKRNPLEKSLLAASCCLAALLSLILSGCGVPGEPLPPLLELPQPIRDLAVEQEGARLVLHFAKPQLTTEGTLIRFLDRIEIHGAFLVPDASAETFPEQGRLLATLPAAQLPDGAGEINYELPLAPGQRGLKAFLAVKAINRREKDAGFSNVASVEIVDLPEPPSGLAATLTEQAIRLSWREAERSVFGGTAPKPDGYEVFRSETGTSAPAQMVGTADSPTYEDSSFTFGPRYVYRVRAFVRRGDSKAVTPYSNAVEVTATDIFPPAAPQNFRAIAVPGAIELSWSPSAEADLAGYNVYRSEGGALVRLNAELLALPLYRDTTAKSGIEYRYTVKAVDRDGNEGPSTEQAIATAE